MIFFPENGVTYLKMNDKETTIFLSMRFFKNIH